MDVSGTTCSAFGSDALFGLVRGSFTVLLMTLAYYLICNGLPVVRQSLAGLPEKISGMRGMLKVMTAFFPDFGRIDYKRFVVMEKDFPDLMQLACSYGLLLLYVAVALWLACAVYQRRDLK